MSWTWTDTDRRRWLLPLMIAGAVAAILMAIFGLPPVSLHGPLYYVGIMGPTCGMTRAVRFAARGEIVSALEYNPAVVVLPIAAAVVIARSIVGAARGRWIDLRVHWTHPAVVVPLAIAGMLLWVHQQTNVALIGP